MSLKQNILEDFNELFVAPKPFDDTLYSVKPEVIREFILRELSLIEQEVRKLMTEEITKAENMEGEYKDEIKAIYAVGCFEKAIDKINELFNN
jgi:hypothetical protein